ncbi:MAG: hypothetical protein QQN63_09870 [Nitrosopumilus sp.]
MLIAVAFSIGLALAFVIPFNSTSTGEKGTLAGVDTEERTRFIQIDRSIEFVTPIPETPQPTASPTPTPTPIPTPKPTPPITPTPYVWVSSAPEVVFDAICNQGLGWNCQQALNVAWCESLWIPTRYNSSGATGLFQIMLPLWWKYIDGDPYDPYVNARAAYRIYAERGNWTSWACYPYG